MSEGQPDRCVRIAGYDALRGQALCRARVYLHSSQVKDPQLRPRRRQHACARRSSAAQKERACACLVMSSQQSINTPVVLGEPLIGGFPTDMDIDEDNLALLEGHDTPSEKVDADFFNGEPCHRALAHMQCVICHALPVRGGYAFLRPEPHSPSPRASSRLVLHRLRGRLRRRRRGMNGMCAHACVRGARVQAHLHIARHFSCRVPAFVHAARGAFHCSCLEGTVHLLSSKGAPWCVRIQCH